MASPNPPSPVLSTLRAASNGSSLGRPESVTTAPATSAEPSHSSAPPASPDAGGAVIPAPAFDPLELTSGRSASSAASLPVASPTPLFAAPSPPADSDDDSRVHRYRLSPDGPEFVEDSHGEKTWWDRVRRTARHEWASLGPSHWPLVQWAGRYSKESFIMDVVSGLSSAVASIPQGMAYAVLAKVPPIYGLYSTTLSVLVYGLLGSSAFLSVGPAAQVNILIAQQVDGLNPTSEAERIRLSVALSLVTGLLLVLLSIFRFGFISKLMSWPVMTGFLAASAFIIGASQLKSFFGASMPSDSRFYMTVYNFFDNLDTIHGPTTLVSFSVFAVFIAYKLLPSSTARCARSCDRCDSCRCNAHHDGPCAHDQHRTDEEGAGAGAGAGAGSSGAPSAASTPSAASKPSMVSAPPSCCRGCATACRNGVRPPQWFPIQLLVLAITIALSAAYDFRAHGIAVVGSIPAGFPSLAAPTFSLAEFVDLIPRAIVVAVVAFMGSVSLSVAFPNPDKRLPTSANVELFALGVASVVGTFVQGLATSGSFSRTGMVAQMGARTPASGIVSGLLVIIALASIAPLFQELPLGALAGLILSSVPSLIKVGDALWLWRYKKDEFAILVAAFLFTLIFGIDIGLVAALLVHLAALVVGSFQPRIAELGALPGTDTFVDIRRFHDAEPVDGVVVLRIDGGLHFGNVGNAIKALRAGLRRAAHRNESTGTVSLLEFADAEGVGDDEEDDEEDDADATLAKSDRAHVVEHARDEGDRPKQADNSGGEGDEREEDERGAGAIADVVAHVRGSSAASEGSADADATEDNRGAGLRASGGASGLVVEVRAATPLFEGDEASTVGVRKRRGAAAAAESSLSCPRSRNACRPHTLIFDGSRVTMMDGSACRELEQCRKELAARYRCRLLFAAFPGPVRDMLTRLHLDEDTQGIASFLTVRAAASAACRSRQP